MTPTVVDPPAVTSSVLRQLRGAQVVVRTPSTFWRGTLLSCVKDSAWFVVDDTDVVVSIHDLVSVRPA